MGGPSDLIALHDRLLGGDRTAFSELAGLLLESLIADVGGHDTALAADAVTTALMDYSERPERFNPAKGSLPGYLRMAARANAKNLLRARRRRKVHEVAAGKMAKNLVELAPSPGNELETDEAVAMADELHRRLLDGLNEKDRPVAELLRRGVRATADYARVMGLAGVAPAKQRAEVKRAKDRVTKARQRLKRP